MDFGQALAAMRIGQRVTRTAWQDPAQNVGIQEVEQGGDATLPYFMFQTVDGEAVPWTLPHSDVLATDWEPVPQ